MGPNGDFWRTFKANPAKSAEVNLAKIELIWTPPGPSLTGKKNFGQKLRIYLLTAYFFIWLKTVIAQPNLHRLTPNFLCAIGTWYGLTMPILPEIKKYLGVLPVPRPKSRFSKIDFFMNFCNFFLLINLAEIFFLESLGQTPKTLKTEFWNSNRKCQKKFAKKFEKSKKSIYGKSMVNRSGWPNITSGKQTKLFIAYQADGQNI